MCQEGNSYHGCSNNVKLHTHEQMHKRALLLGGRTAFRRMTLELLIVSTTLSIAVSVFAGLRVASAPAAQNLTVM